MNQLITTNALNNKNPDWRHGFNTNGSTWLTIGETSNANVAIPSGTRVARFYSTAPVVASPEIIPAPPPPGTSINGTFECNPGVILLESSMTTLYFYGFIECAVFINWQSA